MGLWIKNADGTIERAAGGGGGSFEGEHVLTGDVDNPPEDLAVGQLMWDGVEGGSGGGSAGGTAWNPLYESFNEAGPFEFSTNNAFALDTADVDDEVAAAAAPGPVEPPLVRTWTNTNSFDVAFRIEYQGFVYGSGSRTSYTKIVLRGDGVTDAYSPTCRNWGGMADSTTQVHQGVTGFASCKVEAGATVTWELEAYENIEGSFHNLKWLNFSMGCVPLDSTLLAGGGGDAGPHDHDYLPLEGGVVTGNLTVDGRVKLPNVRSEDVNSAPPNTYITSNGNVGFTTYSHGDEINTAVEDAWRTPVTGASPTDWNDATTPGWCGLILDSAPNGFASRSSGYFHCQVTNYGYTGNLTQTAIPYSLGSDGPAEMWVRTCYNGNWSVWTCVGGAQTGYVSGKGHYRKHADGTLECWQRSNYPPVSIDSAYFSLFLGSMSWVFPHDFSDSYPTVTIGSARWGTGASWGEAYTVSAASTTVRLFDMTPRDATANIYFTAYAIGRWYAIGATFDADAELMPEETEQDRRDRELEALNVEGA